MDDKIKQAIELLHNNGYVVKKFTKAMERDADKCCESGGDGDCLGCSCSVCIVQ